MLRPLYPVEKTNGTPRDERVGHAVSFIAIQVHVQHGDIEDFRINQGKRLIDRGRSGNGGTAEVSQHVFDHQEDQHLILDDKNPPAGKQFSHREHRAARES
jgi:hypothetical protein